MRQPLGVDGNLWKIEMTAACRAQYPAAVPEKTQTTLLLGGVDKIIDA